MSSQTTEQSVVDYLYELSSLIVAGATLDEALDQIFDSFHDLIPYDRIGYADIEDETVVSRWARSNDHVLLRVGFSAPLAGSSLSIVVERRQPRVLNNLPEYLEHRPGSRATSLIVREGIKSSMTCPLFCGDQPLGILFFSSREYDTYSPWHVKIMQEIAMHLAMLLMTSRHTTAAEKRTPLTAASQQPQRQSLLLSQLRPGMVLADSIRIGDDRLLLAVGTELTMQMIGRLVALQQNGFAKIESVWVWQRQIHQH